MVATLFQYRFESPWRRCLANQEEGAKDDVERPVQAIRDQLLLLESLARQLASKPTISKAPATE